MRLIAIIILVFFIGCSKKPTEDQRRKQAEAFYNEFRKELAEKCAKEFPSLPIEIVKGDTIYKRDTIYKDGQTIECDEPASENQKSFVKCPPSKIIKEKIYINDTIKLIDGKQLYILTDERDNYKRELVNCKSEQENLNKQLSELKTNNVRLISALIVLCGLLFFYLVFKIKR